MRLFRLDPIMGGTPMGNDTTQEASLVRIWIINQYALPPDQAGITRNFALAERMEQSGVSSLIIAARTHYMSKSRGVDSVSGRLDRSRTIPFLWIPAPSYKGNGLRRVVNMLVFSILSIVLPLADLVRGRIDSPNIILGSSPNLFAGVSAWALARTLHVPFVLEIRDIHPLSITALTDVSSRHPYVLLLGFIERMLYRRADLIISPLQGAAGHVRNTIGRDRPWIWIPNSVDVDHVPPPPPTRATPKPFTLVYAGAHGLANELHILAQAAQILLGEDIRFILYGDGVAKAELLRFVNLHGLTNVILRDPVPKSEVYELLGDADALVFILPDNKLYDHGLSANKLYDYLACARPVLMATKSTHNPVEAAGAGITVPPNSAIAFAEGTRRMARLSAQERQAMGERGRAFVRQNYHLQSLANSLANRLKTLI